MKILLAVALVLVIATSVCAEQYEVKSRYIDFTPNDGFMDRGTSYNPYEVKNSSGQTQGTIAPKYIDFTPNDGFMDAGSTYNPYVMEVGD